MYDMMSSVSFLSLLVPLLFVTVVVCQQMRDSDSYEDMVTMTTQLGGCGSCRVREEIRSRSLQAIKEQVLQSMGYQQAPNTTGMQLPPVPQHVLAMIADRGYVQGMQGDEPSRRPFTPGYAYTEEEDNMHVKTEKIITFAQPYPHLRHSWQKKDVLYFPFGAKVTRHKVGKAYLNVFVRGAEKRPGPTVILEVFKVHRMPGGQLDVTKGANNMRITQPSGSGDWLRMDVTSMVSEWFKLPDHNLGFIVNGTTMHSGKKVVVTDTTNDSGKAPYVEIETQDTHKRRTRRSGLNCEDHSKETVCCRYPLTVDFEEFGWDFIIAPKRYDAYYCAGECPYLTLQKYAHTHLVVMAQPQSVGPCCAPKKMSAISMLYFDEQFNVIFGSLPGMVVDRCGCS